MSLIIEHLTSEPLHLDRLMLSGSLTRQGCRYSYGWAEYTLIFCGAILGLSLGQILASTVIALSDMIHGGF